MQVARARFFCWSGEKEAESKGERERERGRGMREGKQGEQVRGEGRGMEQDRAVDTERELQPLMMARSGKRRQGHPVR